MGPSSLIPIESWECGPRNEASPIFLMPTDLAYLKYVTIVTRDPRQL